MPEPSTALADIAGHYSDLTYTCGRSAEIEVAEAMERGLTTLDQLRTRAGCAECGARYERLSIIFKRPGEAQAPL